MKILVVDDDKNERELFHTVLSDEGYEVFLAECAEEALGLIQGNDISLVITDISMPVMDGIQLLQKIRNMRLAATDVIMVTGFGEVENYLKAMNLGAADYIIKPVRLTSMRQIVKNVLTRQAARTAEAIPTACI